MRGEFVDISDQRLYYYAAGRRDTAHGGAGRPIVLIHGFPTSSRLWHLVARDFPDGNRLIVVDLPGFGRSDPLPPASASSNAAPCAVLARSIIALLDTLGVESAALVGHGLGGGVAQAVAVNHRERVTHLGLVGSHAFGVTPRAMTRVAQVLEPVTRLAPAGLLAGFVHGSARRGFADPDRTDLSLDACLKPFASRPGRAVLARHLTVQSRCDTSLLSPKLAALGLPVAVACGKDDPFLPTSLAERLAATVPGATLDVVGGARHFVPEDTPDQLIRIIRRLTAR